MKNILITGVSTGIGNGLAQYYLDQGCAVWGVSRREPSDLLRVSGFRFASLDLTDHARTQVVIPELLHGIDDLDLVVLNAGVLGTIQDVRDASLTELRQIMELNTWSNKTVLDCLIGSEINLKQVVTISSGAAVNGNRGWSGYAISKAALNMLTQLYAAENPATHFTALAPGLVDTAMQEYLCEIPEDDRFPSLEVLKSKRNTSEMPNPNELASRLAKAIERLPGITASGGFVDIRNLPSTELLENTKPVGT